MYLNGILIKALSQIIVALTIAFSGFYMKKFNWKNVDVVLCIIVGIVVLVLGSTNLSYFINPNIEQVTVNYNYSSSNGVIFGREYHFFDESGKVYDLTMDFITYRNIFNGNEFKENAIYNITYESKSETIVDIEENK